MAGGFSNESLAARLRGSLTISKCVLLLLLFKMNATRDWNSKGSSCGSVLGQLSHEVLVQPCLRSGLRLHDHTLNLFITIVITLHLFKMIKYYWKARDQRSKSVLLVLHQTQLIISRVVIFLVFYSLCYRISGSTSSLLARQSRRFF